MEIKLGYFTNDLIDNLVTEGKTTPLLSTCFFEVIPLIHHKSGVIPGKLWITPFLSDN